MLDNYASDRKSHGRLGQLISIRVNNCWHHVLIRGKSNTCTDITLEKDEKMKACLQVIYDYQLAQTHAHKPNRLEIGFDVLFVHIQCQSQCLAWIKNSLVDLFLFN